MTTPQSKPGGSMTRPNIEEIREIHKQGYWVDSPITESLLNYITELEAVLRKIAEFGCMGQHAFGTCEEAMENNADCSYCNGKGFNDVERYDRVDQEICILCEGSGDIRICHPCQAQSALSQPKEEKP